jgi:hypothetical protein
MTLKQLREKYSELYPEIADVILDEQNCFKEIIETYLKTTKNPNLDHVEDSEIAYQIAIRFPEHKDRLIDKVTE